MVFKNSKNKQFLKTRSTTSLISLCLNSFFLVTSTILFSLKIQEGAIDIESLFSKYYFSQIIYLIISIFFYLFGHIFKRQWLLFFGSSLLILSLIFCRDYSSFIYLILIPLSYLGFYFQTIINKNNTSVIK